MQKDNILFYNDFAEHIIYNSKRKQFNNKYIIENFQDIV